MKPRRQPLGPRLIPNAFHCQVPDIITARIEVTLQTAKHKDPIGADIKREELLNALEILHLPTPSTFESLFLSGQIVIPEVKIDEKTNRIYLTGGSPRGHRVRELRERKVKDKQERIAAELYTHVKQKDGMVMAYTEVSRLDFFNAVEQARNWPEYVQVGLTQFFQIPESHLPGALLATPSLTEPEYKDIAYYALKNKGIVQ